MVVVRVLHPDPERFCCIAMNLKHTKIGLNLARKRGKLEMCPWDTDAPLDAKFAYSHKQNQKRHILITKGQ